jgi:hypothetical protein
MKHVVFIAAAAGALIATHPGDADGQSWPKVMVNGHGLALTRLAVQERLNGNWVFSPSLRPNIDYRLVWRFTNFFPDVISYGPHVRDIIKISFSAQLSGAVFYPSDSYTGSGTKWLNGYDADGLGPTQSQSFYQHFRWIGPPLPTPLVTWDVTFGAGEVHLLPKASGQVRPTQ